jgi:Fe-S-cluster-containing hydrogenase component 2
VQPEKPQRMWRTRVAYWIRYTHASTCLHPYTLTKTRARTHTHTHTHTHKTCNAYCFSTATVVTWTRLNNMLCIHCLSVCPSLSRMQQLGYHWTEFDKVWHLRGFRKSVKKIQVLLKSCKHNSSWHEHSFHIFDNISLNSSWNEKCSRQKFIENKNTILCQIYFSRKSYPLWDNIEKYSGVWEATNHVTIWLKRVACSINSIYRDSQLHFVTETACVLCEVRAWVLNTL